MKRDAGKSRKSKRKLAAKERFHVTRFVNPGGEPAFRVGGYKPDGTRVRENFKTQEEAVGRKAELDIEAANIVTTTATRMKATRLTDEQIKAAERVYARIGDRSLDEMADFFLKSYREPVRQMATTVVTAAMMMRRLVLACGSFTAFVVRGGRAATTEMSDYRRQGRWSVHGTPGLPRR